jgi:dipeptidyl aminopeptidase/acylaminoacyl peptidase
VKATDLPLLSTVSRPTVHPNGGRAVVSVTRPDFAADAYVGQLWSVPLTGHAAPRRMTRGFRDSAPQFSPDGRLLAFLRSGPRGAPQLFVVDASGGEPVQASDLMLGVTTFVWSPEGQTIAAVSRVPEHGRYGTIDGVEPNAEPPRRFTTLNFRSNGLGYITDKRSQLFLITVPDVGAEPIPEPAPGLDSVPSRNPEVPEARQLTHGDFDSIAPAFSPDGRFLAFISSRHANRDSDLRSNIFVLDLGKNDAEPLDITGEHGSWSIDETAYSMNGTLFFLAGTLGRSGRDFVARNTGLYAIDQPGAAPHLLTDLESVDLSDGSITVLRDDAVLVQNQTRGTVQLLSVTSSGETEQLTRGELEITGAATAGTTIVVSYTDSTTAGDVAVREDGRLRRVSDFSARLRATGLASAKEIVVAARDGYEIHGWVVLPDGDGPHPVLLSIHGGPYAQYSVSVFDEPQVYADAGYAVVMCNPRGSAGYGQAHGRAIRRALGTVDYTDVIDFLDGATAQLTQLDGERVGVMGGSYGGYLTAWTIAHDHRFAGAIVERAFLDPDGFVGTSDIGSFFGDEYAGTNPERVRAQSPQAHVDAVDTPTLVIHSSEDLRCPVSQGERYYAALKRRGVESELLIFPGEDHELTRSGRPRHRQQRFEAVLAWWARYLPTRTNFLQ